ncbi:sensor histidine kinase [Rhodobacteraceae bacterium 10Alg 79]|uniref:histidine kinase n=2 Tax=Rhodalgimonas zhirmunskyi TaxID=2964767 RepID=A0AAJ1UC05_9RHOB|nr:sensor histidine kinase [Rhodoalgimonas zhirmunskyi]
MLLTIYMILFGTTISARPPPAPVPLSAPTEFAVLLPYVRILSDPTRQLTLAEVIAPETETAWRTSQKSNLDFGYIKSVTWLHLPIENASKQTSNWRLHIKENFFQLIEIYTVSPDGAVKLLEALSPTSVFADRDIPYPEITVAFELPPGETTQLYIRYWSGGSSEISFDIHTQESFAKISASRTAKNFIFYGMMLLLVLAALASSVITRQFVFFAYACYALSGLLFVMHADGNTFQYLWPNAPLLNGYATILLGAALISAGGNFARHFLQTAQYNPLLDKILLATIFLGGAMILASIVVDHQVIKKYLVLLATASVMVFVFSGLVAARTRFREVRFFVLAWIGAVISSTLMMSRHWLGVELPEQMVFDSMRVVFVVDAALMGFAIIDRFNMVRQDQRAALETSLSEAKRSLSLSHRLQHLEEQYAVAVELARAQERQMADTVHDLRQPLHALRLNVQSLMQGGHDGQSDLEDTFAYLEQLVTRELSAHSSGSDLTPPPASDATDIDEMMAAVHDMFLAEANAKGIELRMVPSRARTSLPPLALMRILSNLVANAIKYTPEGRVLVGVRRCADGSNRLEVHDSGAGLTPGEFEQALHRNSRLERDKAKQGQGLGLSIVADLARQNSLEIGLCATRRSGAGLYVVLPAPD